MSIKLRINNLCHIIIVIFLIHLLFNDFQESNKVVTIDGYRMVRRNNENALKVAVADQPVSAAVEGYGQNFQLYGNVSFLLFPSYVSL